MRKQSEGDGEHVSRPMLKTTSWRSPGGPTNIYIQGVDSVGQLSTEIRYLKEENESLQQRLQQASKEAALLKEAVLLERVKVKEAELEAQKLAAQSRKQQGEAEANGAEIAQLKHEKQQQQEAVNRCVCACTRPHVLVSLCPHV